MPRPLGVWAGAFGCNGDPAARQGETWDLGAEAWLVWVAPWPGLPTELALFCPDYQQFQARRDWAHESGAFPQAGHKPREWSPGPRSPAQSPGLSFYCGSAPGSQTAPPAPHRPPRSPGNFPVPAGSAARAIYNSHSRLCSAVELPGEPGGRGGPLLGAVGAGVGGGG